MRITTFTLGALALCAAAPALAQTDPVPGPENSPAQQGADQPAASQPIDSGDTAPPKPITLNSTITLVSDYRFRGLTQTGGNAAMQGSVTVGTALGFYVSTWASTIDGRSGKTPALAGYGTEEVDLSGGFTKTFHGAGIDVGLLYYYYPAGRDGLNTDFFEPYASVSYTIGPVAAKIGAAYAWGGQKGLDFRPNNKDDNIYAYGEASIGIPTTPVTLKGHLGYTNGSLGLVNLYSNDDDYLDWSVTAEAVGGPFKVGVSYVDTDLSRRFGDYTVGTQNTRRDRFATAFGRGSTVLGYVGLSF